MQAAPQFGHPLAPSVVGVLENNPRRSKLNELRLPLNPCCFPAIDKSWQGKPAVTIKPSLKYSDAEGVNLAESDGFPTDAVSRESEASDAAE